MCKTISNSFGKKDWTTQVEYKMREYVMTHPDSMAERASGGGYEVDP